MSRLIDADAVLERIERDCDARCPYKDYKEPVRSKMCKCCELGDARMYVEDAPTVDTKRHGHWDSRQLVYECSECGHMGYSDMNYCPNCGALMDEEVEE